MADTAAAKPLLGGSSSSPQPTPTFSPWPRLLLGCGALVALAATISYGTDLITGKASFLLEETSASSLSFSIRSTDYERAPGKGYKFVDTGRIVEPQRLTELKFQAPSEETLTACDWSISLIEGGGVHDDIVGVQPAADYRPSGTWSSDADAVQLNFPSPGKYLVTASCGYESDADAAKLHTVSESVSCYYVRRELRALSLSDRNAFLDTFVLLSKTLTAEGRALYGPGFRSLTDFEIMHLRAASDRALDHIHDGTGQLTQHVAMTMEFELSLQSVKPHLAVPFWDYTIDSAMVALKDGGKDDVSAIFKEGVLFKDDFFGETDDVQHTVTTGRFGHVEVPRDYNFTTRSAFGFLRAPWNINPSKYVTRYHDLCGLRPYLSVGDLNWPTCSNHFLMTNTDSYDTWYDWIWEISYKPHGPVHTWIGGTGGECHTFMSLAEEGLTTRTVAEMLVTNAFLLLKFGWREFLIEMPTFCAADVKAEDCMWECKKPAGDLATALLASNNLKEFPKSEWLGNEEAIATKVFCDTPFWPGDHSEAASPIEASFWPIHPTLDRLYQYRELVRPFTSHLWEARSDELSTKYCNAQLQPTLEYGKGTGCDGHHPYDLTFWHSVIKVASKDGTGSTYVKKHLTNEEVRSAVSPAEAKAEATEGSGTTTSSSYSVPYIYEHFEWDHCAELGVHFAAVE